MKRILPILILAATYASTAAGETPKLIVNIVVSQMRYDYLDRFADNFGQNGFRTFMEQGAFYRNAHHNYMQTITEAGLATITTGANPSEHGIISRNWVDFTTNRVINLIDDSSAAGLDCDAGVGNYSPRQLIAATIGDRLKESDPKSKAVSIASSPYSAIVAGGHSSDTYWVDEKRGNWISSSFYFKENLPEWVLDYNKLKAYGQYVDLEWAPLKSKETYRNGELYVLTFERDRSKVYTRNIMRSLLSPYGELSDMQEILYTPYGNSVTSQFAREVLIQEEMGQDAHTDLLTVVYDTPRIMGQMFGPRSVEMEDMYYRLDIELGSLLDFIFAAVGRENVVVSLTSDHGASDTFKEENRVPMGQFNTDQFKMIMNGFLSAQYEPELWVTEYFDRQLYLNRELIYQYGFNLEEVQSRAAAFALQFRGVAGALTSTSMQSGYFGKGYAEKVQNSFYPKRSGDISINLMPGWIEEKTGIVSTGGSLYEYDTHVPLMFIGGGVPVGVVDRMVDMRSVAPTLSRIMQITVPNASSGEVLTEVVGR